MIDAKILSNGNLKLTADNESRAELSVYKKYYTQSYVVADSLDEKFEFLLPEQIGALTDAPILADCDGLQYDDEGELQIVGNVWWFPDYAIVNPWDELRCKGRVIFTAAPENKKDS